MNRKHFLFAGLSIGLMDGLLFLQRSNYIWFNVIWFFVPILAIAGIILLFTTKNKPIASFVILDIIITITLIKVVTTVFSTISSISKYPDRYSNGYYIFLEVFLILFNLQTLG
ncbi:MAG: hypothetical protein K6B64_05330, partial [Acholeplasmatales bacterium]|nr:hypothetical protein [Acholeplasmatales bacterium]